MVLPYRNELQHDKTNNMCSIDSSDWADAQVDLSLRWVQRSFCWFCHEAAQMQPKDADGIAYSVDSLGQSDVGFLFLSIPVCPNS